MSQHGPMYTIMSNVQLCETFHNKYIKESQCLYRTMDHDAFMFTFIKMIKSAMEAEENNEYANTTLLFCAKFISSFQGEITHPIVLGVFKWITTTVSSSPHIRYRLCQFVNIILRALGPEAALDDTICDSIMNYMITRLSDINPSVRVQAILALQRLQNPDNPDDIVLKTYQFHLSSDPSPKVRMAVITSIGRNFNTIPYILERLWDIDEKVRRHTYLNMSSYPVRSYKVAQRLTFLEQGLSDRSDMVKKVITSVMLPQWLESYNKDYIALISALKLDSTETEIERFRKTAKLALKEMFKKGTIDEFIECLPIERDDLENEFYKCVPHERLSVEVSIYWVTLIEYLQQQMADEVDAIIPELSVFCQYVLKYCEVIKLDNDDDRWRRMEHQYILLGLMEIVHTFDLGDEIGRENLKQLAITLLKNHDINEKIIEIIIRCTENLIKSQEDRLQFFVDIIKDIIKTQTGNLNDFINNRNLIEELLDMNSDMNLKLKVTSLRVKILDLEEQERNYVDKKEYVKAQKVSEDKISCQDEYMNILKPFLNQVLNSESKCSEGLKKACSGFKQPKKVTTEEIVKCLRIAFYMVASKRVTSLTPIVCELYKDFIRRHIESNTIFVRNWALKCGTAYSMLYDQLAKDVYSELYSQFFKNQNIYIWNTSIDCLFELIDRYGFEHFENNDKQNKNKNRRQLYNTLEFLDVDEDVSFNSSINVDVIFMMSHILDTCEHVCILKAIIKGLCRLVLHGHIKNDDIMEKLLLKYFNPATEPEINQILGMFYRNLIKKKRQEYLQPCLLPTINTILTAPYDSPLHEIKPDSVIKFVVDATRPQFCSSGLNIHNTIAMSFMQEMQSNHTNKELIKILSKELFSLEISISEDNSLRSDLEKCCATLLEGELDTKIAKNIKNFKDVLNGNYQQLNLNRQQVVSDEDEEESDHETQATTETAPSTVTNSVIITSETEANKEITKANDESSQSKDKTTEENANCTTDTADNTITNDESQVNQTVIENLTIINETPANNSQVENNSVKETNIEKERENQSQNLTQNIQNLTENTTQNVSSVIPALTEENSTPRKTMQGKKNETAHLSAIQPENAHSTSTTPTTFGRDNNTNMRYLRKSLNLRQSSPNNNEDGPTMPPKIRIEAKMQANVKGIQEVARPRSRLQNLTEITSSNNNSSPIKIITPSKTPTPNKSPTKNGQHNITDTNRDTNSASDTSESEEIIDPSPEAIKNRNGKRQANATNKTSTLNSATIQSSTSKTSKDSSRSAVASNVRSSARIRKKTVNNDINSESTAPSTTKKIVAKKKLFTQTIPESPIDKSKNLRNFIENESNTSPLREKNLQPSRQMNTRSSAKKQTPAIVTKSIQSGKQKNSSDSTKETNTSSESKQTAKISRIPIMKPKSSTSAGKAASNSGSQSQSNKKDNLSKTGNLSTTGASVETTRRILSKRPSNLPVRLRNTRLAKK